MLSRPLLVSVGALATAAVYKSQIPQRFCLVRPTVPHDELRVRGLVVLLMAVTFSVSPLLAILLGVGGWYGPKHLARRFAARRDDAIRAELGLAVDLMALCAQAGSTVPRVVRVVGASLGGVVGHALATAGARLAAAERVDATLVGLLDELGEPARELVAILRSAYFDGAPLAPALQVLAARLRDEHRRRSEAQARRLSVRLLLPLVCCLLPGFVLIVVAPILIDSLGVLAR